jgi:hypothetical protein
MVRLEQPPGGAREAWPDPAGRGPHSFFGTADCSLPGAWMSSGRSFPDNPLLRRRR